MDPVRAHEQVAADGLPRVEVGKHLRLVLRVGHNPAAQLHRAGLTVPQGAAQRLYQVCAMDVQILPAPARIGSLPQGYRQDTGPALAKPQLLRPGPERILLDTRGNPKRLEYTHAVGADLQPGADFFKHVGLLEDGHLVTELLECQRGRQPPDTST